LSGGGVAQEARLPGGRRKTGLRHEQGRIEGHGEVTGAHGSSAPAAMSAAS
jgi:hypothetical protein